MRDLKLKPPTEGFRG